MEIKPQELRLTNLVEWNKEACTVQSIRGNDIGLYDRNKALICTTTKLIKPIELTPEWLVRLGFKQGDNVTSNDSFYVIKLGVSELGINPDNGVCWITNRTGSINNPLCLDFIHQVQNLFYALTGEELAIDKTSLKN